MCGRSSGLLHVAGCESGGYGHGIWLERARRVARDFLHLAFLIPFLFVSIAVYSWITQRFGPEGPFRETYCRKCGYILRGVSEPRCPECGERI